jgi:4-alpha-glucanotransferase
MTIKRSSGILLHVSSLPGKFGIGDAGKQAYEWVDFLDKTGVKYWQILPLNPTGYGDSPYQGLSAFAGNPLFIDLENLVELGLITQSQISDHPNFPRQKVDFSHVNLWKTKILHMAFDEFVMERNDQLLSEFEAYCSENKNWLDDFALFMALRVDHKLVSWKDWPEPFKLRKKSSLKKYLRENGYKIQFHQFLQFLFYRQWRELKAYANGKGIQLIGDIPIFTGFDCADVWANPHLFQLDPDRQPIAIAGVPPDFFSETGQLWGNPLYDWDAHKKEKYTWWTQRVNETLKTVDLIRLDHFRGFAGYFRIPGDAKTAVNGEWVPGPGKELFGSMKKKLGELPFIAEDLGVITDDVIELRDRYEFPGMKLLQFAFWESADHEFLPHNFPFNCVAYTGTHDNDTSKSWFRQAPEHERRFCTSYLGNHTRSIAHEMIRVVWNSVAVVAVAPMQDFLQLDGWARMNLPASTKNNWIWRMKPNVLTDDLAGWIKEINITYHRTNDHKEWLAKEYFTK